MNLKEELKKLVELQKIDKKIFELKNKIKEIPQQIEKLDQEFESKKENYKEIEEEIKKLKLKHKDTELELSSREEQLKKTRSQLYQIKTNQEYQAKLKEIEEIKADCSVIEEKVILLLDEIEEAEKRLRAEAEILKKEEEVKNAKVKELKAHMERLKTELKILEDSRKNKIVHVEKEILNEYERLLEHRQGLAIAAVKDFICTGCNMSIPPQVVNEIKMYKNLVHCEMCARILYIEEEL